MERIPAFLHRFPIRVLIPVLIIVLLAAVGMGRLLTDTRETSRRVETEAGDRLVRHAVRLQDRLAYLLDRGDTARVQAELSMLGREPSFKLAILTDEKGSIIAANRTDDNGRRATELLSEPFPGILQAATQHPEGYVVPVGDDEIRAVAAVLLGGDRDGVQPARRGILVLQRSIREEKAAAVSDMISVAGIVGIGSIVLVVFFAVLFYTLIGHRVRRLIDATSRFSEGDFEVRARLTGRDELAAVGGAFDRMADRLAKTIADLRWAEERRRDLFDINQKLISASNLGILAYRSEGPCVLANEAAAKMVGATVEKMRTQNFREIASWRPSGLLDAAEKTLADGESRELETHMLTTFGRDAWLWCMVSRFESGGLLHLLLLMNDTTHRRQAEAELRLRGAALEAAANVVMITDREGTICWVNPAFCALTGYAGDEVIGRNPRLLKSGRHDAEFYRRMYETILGGTVWRGEIINRYKDGRVGHEDTTITPVHGDDGTITHFVTIKEDITERKLAEQALMESEEKFRAIFDGATDGIVLTDPETGQFREANRRFCDMLGYDRRKMAGLNMRDIHPASEMPAVAEHFNAVLSNKGTVPEVIGVQHRDGTVFSVEISGRPIDIAGTRYVLGIFRDIRERQQKELALREKAVAEQASLAKSLFLANMSHELRTPLNAIIGYSEMLVSDAPAGLDSESLEDLQRVRGAAQHLSSLIDDILNLSKIEAGKLKLVAERFSVAALVQDVSATVTPLTTKNGNELHVECEPEIGEARTDPTRLRQVLFNLLSNAAKFTNEGRIDIVASRRRGKGKTDTLIFEVRDTGIGMNAEDVSRLFQPFVQAAASRSKKNREGTGLGLAISRRIADLMGGDLTVRSEPGKGSVFTFSLPVELPGG